MFKIYGASGLRAQGVQGSAWLGLRVARTSVIYRSIALSPVIAVPKRIWAFGFQVFSFEVSRVYHVVV